METEVINLAGRTLEVPRLQTADLAAPPVVAATKAPAAVDSLDKGTRKVQADVYLSPEGKAAKTGPLQAQAWDDILQARAELDMLAAEADADEAQLYELPSISTPAEVAGDTEARTWWRSLPAVERGKLLRKLGDDGAEGQEAFQKYSRLWQALLRSPIPLPEHETQFVRDVWQRICRVEHVGEYVEIQHRRQLLERSERVFGHAVGIASAATGWRKAQVRERAKAKASDAPSAAKWLAVAERLSLPA